MGFLELTEELLRIVDFEKSKIVQPQKLVFVCGGRKSENPAAPTSMREVLLAKADATGDAGFLGGAKVILAEAAVSQLSQSSFSNLLDLEKYIAATVHAIVLIVESPGSMCELGAFVAVPEIREKLIVVIQSQYLPIVSFITDGAIRYFQTYKSDAPVHGYIWSINKASGVVEVPNFSVDLMMVEIPDTINSVHTMHGKESFKDDLIDHHVYIILAFCYLMRAAKQSEIKRCLDISGINITETVLRQCLDALQVCQLVRPLRHGKLDYYVARIDETPLDVAFKADAAKSDKSISRWIARISKEIQKNKDDNFRIQLFNRRHDD